MGYVPLSDSFDDETSVASDDAGHAGNVSASEAPGSAAPKSRSLSPADADTDVFKNTLKAFNELHRVLIDTGMSEADSIKTNYEASDQSGKTPKERENALESEFIKLYELLCSQGETELADEITARWL